MLPAEELSDIKKYAAALKTEIVKSKTKIAAFRFYYDYEFADGTKSDLVLVGKTPPATLKAAKEVCRAPKAEGECRLVKGDLKIKVEAGNLRIAKLIKALKSHKIKYPPIEVENFAGTALADQNRRQKAIDRARLAKYFETRHDPTHHGG